MCFVWMLLAGSSGAHRRTAGTPSYSRREETGIPLYNCRLVVTGFIGPPLSTGQARVIVNRLLARAS